MKIKNLKTGKKELIIIVVSVILGIALGFIFQEGNTVTVNKDTGTASEKQTLWTCSMHPQIRQHEPGNCPICGMELIPVNEVNVEKSGSENVVVMTESAMKLAEVQTYIVKKGIPVKLVYLPGKILPDERNIAVLTARFGGRIEKLYVNYTGQYVRKGEKLASLYSPELNTAKQELLDAAAHKKENPSFYKATRKKLKLWELTAKQIDAFEKNETPSPYFDILSPVSGTVVRKDVAVGDYLKEGSALFGVVDLSQVWIEFDAYQSDLPWIKKGDEISFTTQAFPGKSFSGKVSFIDPFIDSYTRVAKVRVEMDNPGMKFKPGMFVSGVLKSKIAGKTKPLLIPKTSVLWTGKRSVVYVKIPDGKSTSFVYREISLGAEAGDFYIVESGLHQGEEIASNGVFRIDASAQLSGKPSMMNPEGGKTGTMPGMNMGDTDVKNPVINNENKLLITADSIKIPDIVLKKHIKTLVKTYLSMKNAFVASNGKDAEKIAAEFLKQLSYIDISLDKNMYGEWLKISQDLKNNLREIIEEKNIDMKRSRFGIVSNLMAEVIESSGHYTGSKIYLEYCPMAFDNKGAYWLSDKKEIENPYFGDKMLRCGEVKKEYN